MIPRALGPQAVVHKLIKLFRTQRTRRTHPFLSAQAWEPVQPAQTAGGDCSSPPALPLLPRQTPAAQVSLERKLSLLLLLLPTTPWQQTSVPQVTEEREQGHVSLTQHFSHLPRALTYAVQVRFPGAGVSHIPQETAKPPPPLFHFQVNIFSSSCLGKLRGHIDHGAKGHSLWTT